MNRTEQNGLQCLYFRIAHACRRVSAGEKATFFSLPKQQQQIIQIGHIPSHLQGFCLDPDAANHRTKPCPRLAAREAMAPRGACCSQDVSQTSLLWLPGAAQGSKHGRETAPGSNVLLHTQQPLRLTSAKPRSEGPSGAAKVRVGRCRTHGLGVCLVCRLSPSI